MRMVKNGFITKIRIYKEIINPKKLIETNNNWRKLKKIILLSNTFEFLKFLIEKKIIKKDKLDPKANE